MDRLLPLLLLGPLLVGGAAQAADETARRRVVFVAGEPSHGYGTHEFRAGTRLLADALSRSGLPIEVAVHERGWPAEREGWLEGADALVLYMDGGSAHPLLDHLDEVAAHVARGGGLLVMHYALEVPTGPASEAFRSWIGGFYEDRFSTNPVWRAELEVAGHPAARGVPAFAADDEWYFNLRLDTDAPGFRPLLRAVPDDEARENPTWPRTPHSSVLEARGRTEILAWTLERPDGGRGAGFVGGHFHWNWGRDDYRRLVLGTIAWVAGVPVPEGGVPSATPDFETLREGQDEREPWFFFDPDETRRRFELEPGD